jgi:translation elongation factor EF-Ts
MFGDPVNPLQMRFRNRRLGGFFVFGVRNMVGRIESYTHSDSITQNKGGAMVKIECETDFAARTNHFETFSRQAAKYAYAAGEESWSAIIVAFPYMEVQRELLEKVLKEQVSISEIRILKL